MISGLYTLTSGMVAQVARLEVITNNLANSETPGFKADHLVVSPLIPEGGAPEPLPFFPTSPSAGVEVTAHFTDFSQGPIRPTGVELDVALNGPGFFVVRTPDGLRYTRAGNFTLNRDGELVTHGGHRVQGDAGPIRLERGPVEIDRQGTVSEGGRVVGRLRIVDFPQPYALEKEAGQLFRLRDDTIAPTAAPETEVIAGHQETSNRGVVESIVGLIDTMRTFEAYQRMLQAMDNTVQRAANELGRA